MERTKNMNNQQLYRYAKTRIPAGTHLLSKRPEILAPEQWPPYYKKAKGCEILDLDDNRYFDLSSNGIGTCLLGYADETVNRAVIDCINNASMCTLNPPQDVMLADMMCDIHPWAEQVHFGRCGGEIGAVAARIARASTDRSLIAVCGYHGWHDWYLAANLGTDDSLRGHLLPGLEPLGVPSQLRGTTLTFKFNDKEALRTLVANHGKKLAAIFIEPCRYEDPKADFLAFVREQADQCGALLVFDEITIGWRLVYGGSHLRYSVTPDLAIFAKALGNGYPMACVIGNKKAMRGAGISFISSTYWTESIGPTAAIACLTRMKQMDVPAHIDRIGRAVQQIWTNTAKEHGVPASADPGYACLAHFSFHHPKKDALRTLFTQYMLDEGFLSGAIFYPTMAHTDAIIKKYEAAADRVFGKIAKNIQNDTIMDALKGPVAKSGFTRLND